MQAKALAKPLLFPLLLEDHLAILHSLVTPSSLSLLLSPIHPFIVSCLFLSSPVNPPLPRPPPPNPLLLLLLFLFLRHSFSVSFPPSLYPLASSSSFSVSHAPFPFLPPTSSHFPYFFLPSFLALPFLPLLLLYPAYVSITLLP